MTTLITLDNAGRIVLPQVLRDELHLEPGDALELERAGEQITLRPVRPNGSMIQKQGVWVFRMADDEPLSAETTDDTLRRVREERDHHNFGAAE